MEATSHATRVYVSGPYTSDPEECTARAVEVGDVLLKRGYATFVPHLSHYWDTQHFHNPYEFWMTIDLSWIRGAHALVRIPGASSGADREVEFAKSLGIPVFEWDPLGILPDEHIADAFQSAYPVIQSAAPVSTSPAAILAALDRMAAIFASKNADYADGSSWRSNFDDVGRQMAIPGEDACEMLIAVKQARLRSLRTSGRLPANEAVEDTILDRAVYSLIALAMQLENKDNA